MTVLITGGAGYIGSITTRLIRASGRGVVVLDTLENGHRKAVGDAPFVQGDIADSDLIARVVAEHGVDEVVHFAAYKAVGESMSNPGKYFSNNVSNLRWCIQCGGIKTQRCQSEIVKNFFVFMTPPNHNSGS